MSLIFVSGILLHKALVVLVNGPFSNLIFQPFFSSFSLNAEMYIQIFHACHAFNVARDQYQCRGIFYGV